MINNNPLPSEVIEAHSKKKRHERSQHLSYEMIDIIAVVAYLDELARLNPDLKLPKL